MYIQLALDRVSISEAISVAKPLASWVDWIEVGTSLIKQYGMDSIKEIRCAFPNKTIVADMKTFDNANYEFDMCFAAGADVATVMGASPSPTIDACMNIAAKSGKQVMVDMLNTTEAQWEQLQVYQSAIFCGHISKDQQELSSNGFSSSFHIPAYLNQKPYRIALAGGITGESLQTLLTSGSTKPYVVIIGSAIVSANDPVKVARTIHEIVHSIE